MLTLVRHAHAGSKRRWNGPDDERPLTERGLTEAHGVGAALRAQPPFRLISSPLLRCRQTLGPTAVTFDLEIEISPALGPDATLDETLALVIDPGTDGCVLCTHGEVLNRLLDRWRADGSPRIPAGATTAKGAAWNLSGYPGLRATARYQPPRQVTLSPSGTPTGTQTWPG